MFHRSSTKKLIGVREGEDVLAPHGTARDAKVVRGYVANSGRKMWTAVDRRRLGRFVTGFVSVDQRRRVE